LAAGCRRERPRLVAVENGLSVLATFHQDDSIQTSVINAGVLNTHLRVRQ
jgi:hypothetical protein